MISLLHDSVRNRAEDLRREFVSNAPFRHVVMEPFLDPEFCAELIANFPTFDSGHSINERGEAGRKAVFANIRALGPAYARFDGLMRDRQFLSFIGQITEVDPLIYDPEYIGGGTHENLHGQDLDAHVDFNYHPRGGLHRRLNLIVFLNPEWSESWGGCLELLRDPWARGEEDRKIIVPAANRAVIFETTESSWHGFERIQLPADKNISRRSIAVYFYTKHRAPASTAPPHGTIYFQRPLPEQFQSGYQLREQDVEDISALLARRDKQIQFLYERELEFSEALAALAGSPSFRLGRALTWPLRTLRALYKGR